jgi:hypothetical protein
VDVSTTAAFTGNLTVCIDVPAEVLALPGVQDQLRALHLEQGVWVDRTLLKFDPATNRVCAQVSSLSPFVVAEAPGVPGIKLGDLNGDGKVNVQDATLSLRIAVGVVTPTDAQKAAGDVNHDGKRNVQDTTLILRFAVGALSRFPGE